MRHTWMILALAGCSGAALDKGSWSADTDSLDPSAGGSLGVGQGGAQDFGHFKAILDNGGLPGPSTIDDVGFFNEHKVEFPDATCGEDVCLHGRFGSMGNMITGSDCTIALLGLNTPIDASELARPPLNLSLAVDTSGSMSGDAIGFLRLGLIQMLDELEPEDRVSLTAFSGQAEVLVEHAAPGAFELNEAILGLSAGGGTNIYDGLTTAFEVAHVYAGPEVQNRVILLSDGVATQGQTDPEVIQDIAEIYSEFGFTTTTIGMGTEFDIELMRGLSEVGSGAFYFLEDQSAVQEVFAEELSYFLVPLAEDVTIDVDASSGWGLRAVYGTREFTTRPTSATIEIPNLQIAHRTSHADTGEADGRRGGGGAVIVELLPGTGEPTSESATITFAYTEPLTGERVVQEHSLANPLGSNESPDQGWFADDQVEKSFVMLNIYTSFRAAAQMAEVGSINTAVSVLAPLRANVQDWLLEHDDDDIEDDLRYVDLFIDNLTARQAEIEALNEQDDDWLWD